MFEVLKGYYPRSTCCFVASSKTSFWWWWSQEPPRTHQHVPSVRGPVERRTLQRAVPVELTSMLEAGVAGNSADVANLAVPTYSIYEYRQKRSTVNRQAGTVILQYRRKSTVNRLKGTVIVQHRRKNTVKQQNTTKRQKSAVIFQYRRKVTAFGSTVNRRKRFHQMPEKMLCHWQYRPVDNREKKWYRGRPWKK